MVFKMKSNLGLHLHLINHGSKKNNELYSIHTKIVNRFCTLVNCQAGNRAGTCIK